MKRAWLAAMLVGVTLDAQALGNLATVEVLDRDTGEVLSTYRHHGEYWVAGRPGARFSIVVHNRGDARILAVTAVDGVNVISGESAAWLQTGYVFDPQQGYEIAGWRKSNSEVADFNFTNASGSYAVKTGRPANVGVIGVAIFVEQIPKIAAVAPAPRPPVSGTTTPGIPLSDAAPNSAAAETNMTRSARPMAAQSFAKSASPQLGTGHGAREVSYVRDVPFERMSNTPNEIVRIRYDSLENLIALGVVSRRLSPPGVPNPFPESPEQRYVPDPPSG